MEEKGNIIMGKYLVGRLLGQGTFANVYYGINIETGQTMAIKVMDKEKLIKLGFIKQTKREISIMGLVKHENIVQLHEVMATKTKIYFIMEYAKGGELFDKIVKGPLSEHVARKYFRQLIRVVSFCHRRGVYHRDLKPENLLLDEDGNLKVTDFGLSALLESRREDGLLHTTCGTPGYVAPEVMKGKGYNGEKADIWSCGVVLYVMLAGHLPFHDDNTLEMYKKISRADYKCPNFFSLEVRRLLLRILDPNPHTRCSISKIMHSSWFRKGLDVEKTVTTVRKNRKRAASEIATESKRPKSTRVTNLNAFDIISLSTGFDLSGLFVNNDQKDEVQFTSTKSISTILSRLEQIAGCLKMKVMKKDKASLKLTWSDEGGNGNLSIGIEIYDITSSYHVVEVKKYSGDTIEYQNMLRRYIRPGLGEIVWSWQGEQKLLKSPKCLKAST